MPFSTRALFKITMRKLSNYLLLFLSGSLLVGISACNKDDDTEEPDVKKEPEVVKINTIPEFYPQAPEESYGSQSPEYTVFMDRADGIDAPHDLEFHPAEERKEELWVLNKGNGLRGAFTVIGYGTGTPDQTSEKLTDGNAYHFAANATSMAFGENENWATAQGVVDANWGSAKFTGPTLWSSDMSIYAKVGFPPSREVNGSHLDMIHQSPMGMGIAHEVDNVYWVYDGFNANLVRYDFAEPHYPGGDYHGDGKVLRHYDVKLTMNENIPSHMVLDKETGILYICDTGTDKILQVDINTGTKRTSAPRIPIYAEQLAEYAEVDGTEHSTFASEGINVPCGIALVENRLFVGNNATGEILCFDKESGEELGRLNTGAESLMGITIGPEGKLWYVDHKNDEVVRVDPAEEVI